MLSYSNKKIPAKTLKTTLKTTLYVPITIDSTAILPLLNISLQRTTKHTPKKHRTN
jgi:hypothetical protein